jgi:hypothetical protein
MIDIVLLQINIFKLFLFNNQNMIIKNKILIEKIDNIDL